MQFTIIKLEFYKVSVLQILFELKEYFLYNYMYLNVVYFVIEM